MKPLHSPPYSSTFLAAMTDDELVKLMVDQMTKNAPALDREKVTDVFANRMKEGRDKFLLLCGLRRPRHSIESLEQDLYTGWITIDEFETKMIELADQQPDLESLVQVHQYYESQTVLYSTFLKAIIAGFKSELSCDVLGVSKSQREANAAITELSKQSPFYDIQLQQAFEFYRDLNGRQIRGVISITSFTSDTAHFLAAQVVSRVTQTWEQLQQHKTRSFHPFPNQTARSPGTTFYEHYLNQFPRPQQVLVLLSEEFARARVYLEPKTVMTKKKPEDTSLLKEDDLESIEPVNSGMYGSVYRAFQTTLQRPVAIKVIKPEWKNSASILDHARALSAAGPHPHLVTIYEVRRMKLPGHKSPQDVVIMEWLDGVRLGDRFKGTKLSAEEGKQYILDLISGIRQLHSCNVAHRDLTFGNLFLTTESRLKVFDADPNKDIWLSEQSDTMRKRTVEDDVASVRQLAYEIAIRSSLKPSQVSTLDDLLGNSNTLDDIASAVCKGFTNNLDPCSNHNTGNENSTFDQRLLVFLGETLLCEASSQSLICLTSLKDRYQVMNADEFISSISILEEAQMIEYESDETQWVFLTSIGFENFLTAHVKDYHLWIAAVKKSIVVDGFEKDQQIAQKSNVPISAVQHILKMLANAMQISISTFNTGIEVDEVSYSLKRDIC